MSHISPAELLAIAVALYVLGITTGLRWVRHLAPRRMDDPNPYGELPPVIGKHSIWVPLPPVPQDLTSQFLPESPNGTALKPEPRIETAVWLATLDPITREPNGGALPVAIRQNANIHARN